MYGNNERIARNTLLLYCRMLFLLFINLYSSRLILRELGIEDYGIYNVIGGVITLFTFVSGAMSAVTQRFLSYHIGRDDEKELCSIFNACRLLHVLIAIGVLVLAEGIGLWFLYTQMVIPETRLAAAFWVFQSSLLTVSLVIFSYPYNAIIISHEQMGVFAVISIVESVMKLLAAYVLSFIANDHLVTYALLLLFCQLTITMIYHLYCQYHFEATRFVFVGISNRIYKQLISFSGWNLLGNLANVFLVQGTNVLLNLFFGPTVNAAKGISVQVQSAVNSFCVSFQTALNPQIIKYYASGKMENMQALIFRSSRFSYYLTLVFTLPVLMKTSELLTLWLVDVPDYAVVFVRYAMLFNLIQSLANPLLTGCMATGNVKKIMSVIAVLFWSIIPLGYIAFKLGYDPVSIFQIQFILYVIAHVLRVRIVFSQLGFSIHLYIKSVICKVMLVTIISCVLLFWGDCYEGEGMLMLFSYLLLSVVCIVIIVLLFDVSKAERDGMKKVFIDNLLKL